MDIIEGSTPITIFFALIYLLWVVRKLCRRATPANNKPIYLINKNTLSVSFGSG